MCLHVVEPNSKFCGECGAYVKSAPTSPSVTQSTSLSNSGSYSSFDSPSKAGSSVSATGNSSPASMYQPAPSPVNKICMLLFVCD